MVVADSRRPIAPAAKASAKPGSHQTLPHTLHETITPMTPSHQTPGRTPARLARAAALGAAASLLAALTLGGCSQILGEDLDGLTITVTNHTHDELTIRLHEDPFANVGADATADVHHLGAKGSCIIGGVTAATDGATLVATMPTPICDGDTWVIEPSDLVPTEDASPTPTPQA